MPDGDGARDRIFAAQDHRQRAALSVDAIHHAEPSGERVHLTGARPLEPRDLSPEHLDVVLGLLDSRLEPRDVALLGREPTLDLLELGQERCLARPRRGGTLPLLFELLLGLLQLSLLGLERVVAARLGGRRDDREQGEDRRERRAAHDSRPAPTARPIGVRSRCQCESCSTQSTLPAPSSASGRAARRATNSRAPSGVAAAAAGVTSSDAGSGFAGSWSTTLASLPRTCLSP